MSDLLSAQLLREMNDELSQSDDDEPFIHGEVEVDYELIPGKREGSELIWAFNENNLYYKNSYSRKKRLESCKCTKKRCTARLYIRDDGSAFRKSGARHFRSHGSMYTDYKETYCFNKMKEIAGTALASTTTFQIYQEVIKE